MSSIKDRNCMDLTEAQDVKRCKKTQKDSTKKGLNDPNTTMGWSARARHAGI